jgi:hypothetical protein
MTMRTYWCVLTRMDTKRWSGKAYFAEVDGGAFNRGLDLDRDRDAQLRGAMLALITQTGGGETDIGWYRMDVYDDGGNIAVRDYTASPDGGAYLPPGSLDQWTDDQLIGELARRLHGR